MEYSILWKFLNRKKLIVRNRIVLMFEFENVTVVKAVDNYFDGQVTSRTVRFAGGSEKHWGLCCLAALNLRSISLRQQATAVPICKAQLLAVG